MVPFAGYDMPVQYPLGVMGEHLATRASAGLFDVSHMGQIKITPKSGDMADAALALEQLVPVDILDLPLGRQRYALLTNDAGGILDDLMVARFDDHLFVVVNAACKDADSAHLEKHLSDQCDVEMLADRSLLAVQGPGAEAALQYVEPYVSDMKFMDVYAANTVYGALVISRSGYSGEDGFEVSVATDRVEEFARYLLNTTDTQPIGLGARDSLRLEAGLCLYGNDIDTTTTPVEASLSWAIQKSRRKGGARAGGFPGADIILDQLENGVSQKRIGLLPEGRAPMRAGTKLFASQTDKTPVGEVTSGAFGPSLQRPVSMAYVTTEHSKPDTTLWADVRGKRLAARVAPMPFQPTTFKR
ncbi:UNVERIFIED_CONTAM: hypothetical protein GTU68_049084 [Idotea baltica]|nr:hypothetical protein [Idotea baltica]